MSKYLKVGTGAAPFVEEQAIGASAGSSDADKIIRTDASGKIDASFMPSGFGADIIVCTASGAISAGDIVTLTGATTVARANASSVSTRGHGIALENIANAATGQIAFGSYIISGLSGLTAGAQYYLSTTAGQITTTVPTGSGEIVQPMGTATNSTTLYFEPSQAIIQRS